MAHAAVRAATLQDVPTIAALHRDTWRAAYSELLPEAVLAELGGPEAEQAWADALAGEAIVLLATEGTTAVGFCVAGPAPAEEVAAADGALPADAGTVGLVSTLLVEPRWGRRGHGGRLLATTARTLLDRGATRGIAWVPTEDVALLGFYRSAGWEPDGTVRVLDTGERTVRELRVTGSLDLRTEEA